MDGYARTTTIFLIAITFYFKILKCIILYHDFRLLSTHTRLFQRLLNVLTTSPSPYRR